MVRGKVKSVFVSGEGIPFEIKEGETWPAITGTCRPMTKIERGMYFDKALAKDANTPMVNLEILTKHITAWSVDEPLTVDTFAKMQDGVVEELLRAVLFAGEVKLKN